MGHGRVGQHVEGRDWGSWCHSDRPVQLNRPLCPALTEPSISLNCQCNQGFQGVGYSNLGEFVLKTLGKAKAELMLQGCVIPLGIRTPVSEVCDIILGLSTALLECVKGRLDRDSPLRVVVQLCHCIKDDIS